MKENIIQIKTFNFAIEIIETYKRLKMNHEYVLSKQILRSETSINANIEEARGTLYWIKLLEATNYIEKGEAFNLKIKITEICKILSAILVSSKK